MTIRFDHSGVSRRVFLGTASAVASSALLPTIAAPAATYVRYNATGARGQDMLKSYAIAIERMMNLPPTDARNWFRNAFIHTLDCPHMNWWFFVWHRGYLGWFEQTVREMSGNKSFAFPYWDWSEVNGPQPGYCIPKPMLDGVLTPISEPYSKYMSSFDTFYNYLNPAMETFWKSLSADQLAALNVRGMPTLDSVWTQVKGGMFQVTPNARYLRSGNACLSEATQGEVSKENVEDGLSAPTFDTFNSGQTKQHSQMSPSGGPLESGPHNQTHNNVGGYTLEPNSDVGVMADNLSPIDPLFFLHHSNMDRLWDVWTRRQQFCHRPALPTGTEWTAYAREKFMFYVNPAGNPVTQTEAGSYTAMAQFGYTYEPGTGEEMTRKCPPLLTAARTRPVAATVKGGIATLAVAPASLAAAPGHPAVASVRVPYPANASAPRTFAVLVNAPPGNTDTSPKSPYFAGTIGFFGFMPGMSGMSVDFEVPLTRVLKTLKASKDKTLSIQVVPLAGKGATLQAVRASTVEAASVTVW